MNGHCSAAYGALTVEWAPTLGKTKNKNIYGRNNRARHIIIIDDPFDVHAFFQTQRVSVSGWGARIRACQSFS